MRIARSIFGLEANHGKLPFRIREFDKKEAEPWIGSCNGRGFIRRCDDASKAARGASGKNPKIVRDTANRKTTAYVSD